MSQCLYFVASQMDIANNNDENSNLIVMDEFVEDSYDAKQILLKSIIAEVRKKMFEKYEKLKICDLETANTRISW
ncbi:4327_t:CDS:2 [Ambispora gerdemannii]|uniref:4327_t:CDS:1 n=1 Tax=Ambispora gerdemannii TaxID=144530 RepID=A0A9N9D3E7_9GLOM|nr:4327_t:CDS:2 [Ambispora gerdemannii]